MKTPIKPFGPLDFSSLGMKQSLPNPVGKSSNLMFYTAIFFAITTGAAIIYAVYKQGEHENRIASIQKDNQELKQKLATKQTETTANNNPESLTQDTQQPPLNAETKTA
jgi:hypothetical protein